MQRSQAGARRSGAHESARLADGAPGAHAPPPTSAARHPCETCPPQRVGRRAAHGSQQHGGRYDPMVQRAYTACRSPLE
eukprot:jgi/Chrpa1/27898/Chrysochromulina_OHIO_Genome00006842-RA